MMLPSALAGPARQDAWLSMAIAVLVGLGIIIVYTSLALNFPDQNFIQYSETILGKFLGKTVGLIMIWFALHLGSVVLTDLGYFLTTSVLPYTPMVVINTIMMLLVVNAVKGGLEVFSRVNDLLFIILVLLVFVLTFLSIPVVDIKRVLPVMENGIKPVIAGSLAAIGFPFAETMLFTMIIPYIDRPQKVKRALLLGGLAGGLLLLFVITRTLLTLGAGPTARFWFPALEAVRMINLFDIIQRVESIIIINWVGFGFIKIAVCFYAFVLGLAQWLNLKDYRPLVLPAGVLMTALSLFLHGSFMENIAFASKLWTPYALPITFIIPLIMLIKVSLRKIGKKGGPEL